MTIRKTGTGRPAPYRVRGILPGFDIF